MRTKQEIESLFLATYDAVIIQPVEICGHPLKDVYALAIRHCYVSPVTAEFETIKENFIFDGASIPAFAWWLVRLHPFSPRVLKGAVRHDHGYRNRRHRKKTDKGLYRDLRADGINQIRAWLFYRMVRLVGWVQYLPDNNLFKRFFNKVL